MCTVHMYRAVASVQVTYVRCVTLCVCLLLQHKVCAIQNSRPLGPVAAESQSSSEIDFYIDGVSEGV